jgi:hypothetical protein
MFINPLRIGCIPSTNPFLSKLPSEMALLPCTPSPPFDLRARAHGSAFGFEMAYGIATIEDPEDYIQMETMTVAQDDHFVNFTGNLLSNRFWWNVTADPLPEGQYRLVMEATFSACQPDSPTGTKFYYFSLG